MYKTCSWGNLLDTLNLEDREVDGMTILIRMGYGLDD
jgi:hypothetical protein